MDRHSGGCGPNQGNEGATHGEHQDDLYTADERRLLDAWVTGRALTPEDEALLCAQGFYEDHGETYTRLNAWVGTFAVQDIQERLPNCGNQLVGWPHRTDPADP